MHYGRIRLRLRVGDEGNHNYVGVFPWDLVAGQTVHITVRHGDTRTVIRSPVP